MAINGYICGLFVLLVLPVQTNGNSNNTTLSIDDLKEFTDSIWDASTTFPPELVSLDPDTSLEEVDAMLGTSPAKCVARASQRNIHKIIMEFFGNTSLTWILCRCYKLGCVGQTEEDKQQKLQALLSEKEVVYDEFTISAITSYGMVILIGVIGNILVLLTILTVFRPVSVTNMYIFSLSVADLLVCCVCIPLKLHSYVMSIWLHGDEFCKIMQYLYFVLFMCSVFTLTAMSLERWFVICFPMKAQYISSVGRTRVIIAIAWIIACVLALPVAFHAGKQSSKCLVDPNLPGRWPRSMFLYILIAVFFVPCCVIGFAYFHTAKVLWKSLKVSKKLTGQSGDEKNPKGNSSNEIRSRIAVIQLLITIWVIFVLCWGPYLIFNVITRVIPDYYEADNYISATSHNHLLRAFNLLSMANSAVNPVLYAFMSRQFRHGFFCVMTCQPIRTRRDVSSVSRVTGVSSITMSAKV